MKSLSVIILTAVTLLVEVSMVQCYVGYETGVPIIIEKDDSDLPIAIMMLMAMNNPRPPSYVCGNGCGCGSNCGCGKSCNPINVPIPLPIPIPINNPAFVRPPYYGPGFGSGTPLPRPGGGASGDTASNGLLNLVVKLLNNANVDVL